MNYTEFKSICAAKYLEIQYEQQSGDIPDEYSYYLYTYDGPIKYECSIISLEDISNFENTYKGTSNHPLQQKDSAGNLKVRPRDVEGTLALVYCYFTTRDPNSLDCSNNPHYTITTSETATETLIDFKPNYKYWITGGYLRVLNSIPETSVVKAYFIFAPDFTPVYGGNWYFINNKKLCNNENLIDLIVPSKEVKYYSSYPEASAMRLKIEHELTDSLQFEFYLRKFI